MADYWSNVRTREGVPLLNVVVGGKPYIREGEIWPQELRNIPLSYSATHNFDILNRLDVTRKCERQTDGQTRS